VCALPSGLLILLGEALRARQILRRRRRYAHVGNAQARDAGERIGAVISLAAVRAAREAATAIALSSTERDVSKV